MLKETIESKLMAALTPVNLEIIDESHRHNVPEGAESHFKVVIVSDQFANLRLLQRHRLVNQALATELAHHIHALSIHTYTPQEWTALTSVPESPPCFGGEQT